MPLATASTRGALFLALSLASVTTAKAALIDFNTVPSLGNPLVTSITTGGFTFTSPHFHTFDLQDPTVLGGGFVSNGSRFIFIDGPLGQPIAMTRQDGGAFNISRLDAAPTYANAAEAALVGFSNAQTVNVLGNLLGGGVVSTAFTLTPGVFTSFDLPSSFVDLTSVLLSGAIPGQTTNASISFDNLVVELSTAVIPEPSSIALLAAGLGVLGFAWRRVNAGIGKASA